MRRFSRKVLSFVLICLLVVASLFVGVKPFSRHANAAYLGPRSIKQSDARAGAHGVTYQASFTITTPGTLGSVEVEFCSNGTLIEDPCDPPFGFDADNVVLSGQSGISDFTVAPESTMNDVVLSRAPSAVGAIQITVTLDNLTNPTNEGSYFVRFITHASIDASDPPTDSGGAAFAIGRTINVSTEVPPYLTFCLGVVIPTNNCSSAQGDYVNVGDMGSTYTSSGQTQLLTATNATSGYNIVVQGPTMTSGNNEIPIIVPGGQSVAGISQFGINLRANTNPQTGHNPSGPGNGVPTTGYNQPNRYRYLSGDTIARSTTADDYRKYTVSYIINVGANQPPGIYASTFTYIATGNF